MRKLQMNELNRVSVDKFHELEKMPVVIVLDNIRSQHNIGSVFRTADAFRVEKIVLCGISATPPNREIQKTALGATESVSWSYSADVTETLSGLKSEGYKIIAVEQAEGSISLAEFISPAGIKLALVFGNEVNGVSNEAMAQADQCIEIPQFGTKHSFNISVTAGIVLWEMFNKLLPQMNF
ncbi:MAG TPA: RNA methyltransferase [Bacteroidales bacterium]|nr:RNA methyltransferase [Bacteroidales bacterium]HPT02631.1 RNA methyltransferase [Bacteroidales bacterium]